MDLTINVENYKLNIRAAGIIEHNGKILVHKEISKDHYALIGGRVKIGEDSLKKEKEKAQTYNENLSGDPVHDPFVFGSGYALPENYKEVLNLSEDGIMGYIQIPKILVDLPIYHGTSEEVLEKGVGHIQNTSVPIGGNSTHSVLTGHTGLPNAELFTRLDELVVGDIFYIHVLNEILTYKVYEINLQYIPIIFAKSEIFVNILKKGFKILD